MVSSGSTSGNWAAMPSLIRRHRVSATCRWMTQSLATPRVFGVTIFPHPGPSTLVGARAIARPVAGRSRPPRGRTIGAAGRPWRPDLRGLEIAADVHSGPAAYIRYAPRERQPALGGRARAAHDRPRRGAIQVSDVAGQSVTTAARLGLKAGEHGRGVRVRRRRRPRPAGRHRRPRSIPTCSTRTRTRCWTPCCCGGGTGDGDLTDALINAIPLLADDGVIWLLTPKTGRGGYVEPSEIAEATRTAGLAQTTSVPGGRQWMIARLARPKSGRCAADDRRRPGRRRHRRPGLHPAGRQQDTGDTVVVPRQAAGAAGLLPVRVLRHAAPPSCASSATTSGRSPNDGGPGAGHLDRHDAVAARRGARAGLSRSRC